MIFGKILLEFLVDNNLTQKEFAATIDKDESVVSRWIANPKMKPHSKTLQNIQKKHPSFVNYMENAINSNPNIHELNSPKKPFYETHSLTIPIGTKHGRLELPSGVRQRRP